MLISGRLTYELIGRTKLANVLYTKELQRRLDEESVPIIVISLHPGTVNTGKSFPCQKYPFFYVPHAPSTDGNQSFAKKKGGVIGAVYGWWANHFFAVPDAGALNSVFAAVAPTVRSNPEKYKGSFLQPTGVISTPSKDALSVDLARELWGTTESVLKEIGVEV